MKRSKKVSASITKYNPAYRVDGIYTKNEWTCISDVGKYFDGVPFNMEEYLQVENKYIQCVDDMLKRCKVTRVRVKGLEVVDREISWKNKQYISIEQVSLFMKDCLRNRCWARLKGRNFFIHFGYDYYMYVACTLSRKAFEEIVKNHELFCVFMKSPYRESVELPLKLRDIVENHIYVNWLND